MQPCLVMRIERYFLELALNFLHRLLISGAGRSNFAGTLLT